PATRAPAGDPVAAEHCRAGMERLRRAVEQEALLDAVDLRMVANECRRGGIAFDEDSYRNASAQRALRDRQETARLEGKLADAVRLRGELLGQFARAQRQADDAYALLQRQNAAVNRAGELLVGAVEKPLQEALETSGK